MSEQEPRLRRRAPEAANIGDVPAPRANTTPDEKSCALGHMRLRSSSTAPFLQF
jgi:hypothetical protein